MRGRDTKDKLDAYYLKLIDLGFKIEAARIYNARGEIDLKDLTMTQSAAADTTPVETQAPESTDNGKVDVIHATKEEAPVAEAEVIEPTKVEKVKAKAKDTYFNRPVLVICFIIGAVAASTNWITADSLGFQFAPSVEKMALYENKNWFLRLFD
jgi:hypothetical protein